jgi:2-C-methyl-D-erythritol 4-phosphate cytidylyltransferase/2-C-methyl-D-erythritol 2,4-cyclodiphosphate synthase
MNVSGIVAAGGSGVRFGSPIPKQFLLLAGKSVLHHSVSAMLAADSIQEVVVAVPAAYMEQASLALKDLMSVKPIRLVEGGTSRQESVKNALLATDSAFAWVAVHDAARPLVRPEAIDEVCLLAQEVGAALLACPVQDTVKQVDENGFVLRTLPRQQLFLAQTPQVCKKADLLKAYEEAESQGISATDEAGLLELVNMPVAVLVSQWSNFKITEPPDLELAELVLRAQERRPECPRQACQPAFQPNASSQALNIRVGMGYDAHRLVPNRRLMLGGVQIPYELGLEGHSDADVLLHALCDAILGAMAKRDIGAHFPDSNMRYKDISSLLLLKEVMELAHDQGFSLLNADITLVAQAPKLSSYFEAMQAQIAQVCGVSAEAINIKATTTEGMGFTGRGEGMACYATVLLQKGHWAP